MGEKGSFKLGPILLSFWTPAIVLAIMVSLHLYISIPSEKTIRGCFTTKMYQIDFCPGSADYVPLRDISAHIKNAIIISEDSSFYQHNGFDVAEMKESLKKNIKLKTFARG